MEFLLRAKQQGYAVSDYALQQGLKWLDDYSRNYRLDDSEAIGARAYAYYVLASAKAGDISGLRYLSDNYLKRAPSALAAAQMGAALALLGDQQRAAAAFKAALERVDRERRWMRDYGSSLRDLAAIVTLMIESKMTGQDPAPLLDRLANLQLGQTYLTTQEQAWLIMAAHTVADAKPGNMVLNVDGAAQEPRKTALNLRPTPDELAKGVKVDQRRHRPGVDGGDGHGRAESRTCRRSRRASPSSATTTRWPATRCRPTPSSRATSWWSCCRGKSVADVYNQALMIDLLPAGFEVENARLADTRSTNDLAWLPELTPTLYSEYLDDRFVAAFDLDWEHRSFTVAYLVRAVTPGTYHLPAAQVEDMYQPQYRARTATGMVTVTPLQ